MAASRWRLFRTEDTWAIWLGLGVIALAMAFFWAGSSLRPFAVTPGCTCERHRSTRSIMVRVNGTREDHPALPRGAAAPPPFRRTEP